MKVIDIDWRFDELFIRVKSDGGTIYTYVVPLKRIVTRTEF